MDQTNAITDQKTETTTAPTASDVMYDKTASDQSKQVTESAEAPKVQDAKAESAESSDQKQGETKEVKIELKLPEGSHLTQAEVDEIASFAKDQGLSQEAAQKLLEREHSAVDKFKTDQLQQFEQKREEWWKAVESDKELGGDNFKQTAENARRALEKFAPESIRKFFAESPYGNHPELIRMFNNIGKAMQDDKLVVSGSQTDTAKSHIDILYDKQT